MSLIENIGGISAKNAALFYKTEPFRNIDAVRNYVHTNNWEIIQSIKILNECGYSVDLIDRDNHNWTSTKTYDIFLGLGVGNSGRNFVKHATTSKASKKILLAMGPQPDVSNKLTLDRYKQYNERTGRYAPPMRTVEDVIGANFIEIINNTDYIFNIGEKNTPSYNSFIKYGKPVLNFYPSISPHVSFNSNWFNTRDINSFLCFAGNGFICKGVDLVVESFLNSPDKQLHICGPNSERAFFDYYGDLINNAPNIKYHGFITPGQLTFNELASKCSFVIFHSAAEGCCTSVATAMKSGLVPIANAWTGIIIKDIGIELSESGNLIKNITNGVNVASSMNKVEYKKLVTNTLTKASLFSQESFTKSYTEAIRYVLEH